MTCWQGPDGCGSWCERSDPVTPDTRTTENPEPRTAEGKALADSLPGLLRAILSIESEAAQLNVERLAEALVEKGIAPQINRWSHTNEWAQYIRQLELAAEAAQGAAPRAEGLDVDGLKDAAERLIICVEKGITPPDYWAADARRSLALAPQERRD